MRQTWPVLRPPLPPPSTGGPHVPLFIVGLTKHFGATCAIDRLSLAVPAGSCFGVVGPNGSGKTTTLRSVVGLVRPDAGRIEVHGVDVADDVLGVRSMIGAVLDPLQLFERLSAREMLATLGEIRGLDTATVAVRSDELFEVMRLDDDADRHIAGYSHGMRKKTALAAALLHRPRLLLLDEPFEGVDPVSARTMRLMLDRFRSGGGTVVLSSHAMDLVERLCDHVAVVHDGRVVLTGPTEALRGDRRLEDAFIDIIGERDVDGEALSWLV